MKAARYKRLAEAAAKAFTGNRIVTFYTWLSLSGPSYCLIERHCLSRFFSNEKSFIAVFGDVFLALSVRQPSRIDVSIATYKLHIFLVRGISDIFLLC